MTTAIATLKSHSQRVMMTGKTCSFPLPRATYSGDDAIPTTLVAQIEHTTSTSSLANILVY